LEVTIDGPGKKKDSNTSSVSMICSVNVIYTWCTESFNMWQYTLVNTNNVYYLCCTHKEIHQTINAECWLRYQHAHEKII